MQAIRRFLRLMALCGLLALCVVSRPAGAETAYEITDECTIQVSAGRKGYLTDHKVRSYWGPWGVNSSVTVTVPEGVSPGAFMIEWYKEPKNYILCEYDAANNLLSQRTQDDTFCSIFSTFPLDSRTKTIELTIKSKNQMISAIYVYSAGELPPEAQNWEPPVDKTDVMVVVTHQDDELIFLGGTIPYYAVARNAATTVVYMTDCERFRRDEALRGLWAMGVRNYPEFLNLPDERVASIKAGLKLWGGESKVLGLLVERIRRFRPEVIVTQDLKGETGHKQHMITASIMKDAIEAAADPSRYPESYALYGAWQTKKLYNHLYPENQIVMDWETPLEAFGGLTALQMAQLGYEQHASQHHYYSVESGGPYDNSLFGLSYSVVGPDVVGGDMLENIYIDHVVAAVPAAAPAVTEAPPEPTEEAQETPSGAGDAAAPGSASGAAEEEPSPEPAQPDPTETPEPAVSQPSGAEKPRGGRRTLLLVWLACLLLGAGLLFLRSRRQAARRRRARYAPSAASYRQRQAEGRRYPARGNTPSGRGYRQGGSAYRDREYRSRK